MSSSKKSTEGKLLLVRKREQFQVPFRVSYPIPGGKILVEMENAALGQDSGFLWQLSPEAGLFQVTGKLAGGPLATDLSYKVCGPDDDEWGQVEVDLQIAGLSPLADDSESKASSSIEMKIRIHFTAAKSHSEAELKELVGRLSTPEAKMHPDTPNSTWA